MSSFSHLVYLCFSLISPHTLRAEGENKVKKANSSQRNSGTAFVISHFVMTVETNDECWYLISLCECWRRVFMGMHLFHVKGIIYHTISEPEKKQIYRFHKPPSTLILLKSYLCLVRNCCQKSSLSWHKEE